MSWLRTTLLSAAAFAVALPVTIGWLGGYMKTEAGEVAVVRNGGLFDDNQIRQVIDAGSALTWTGFWSTSHRYPAQQRFYTIAASGDTHNGQRAGIDVVTVPSSDGVSMGIEGTFYFSLNLDHDSLRTFDDKFGTRTFRGADGEFRHAWDGDIGWSSFLDQIVRPVIDNAIREQVNTVRCAELVSSCALVQNQGGALPVSGQPNNANITNVQNAIVAAVHDELRGNLGGDFLSDIKFTLAKVTLPAAVQQAVDNAQAAYAQVTESQARASQAQADAAANEQRQRGYNACPACAQIDIMKAIPPNVTVYAPGAGGSVPLTPPR